MLKCWHGDPEERPTFSELVSLMSQTLEGFAGYMDVSTFGKLEVHVEDPHDEARALMMRTNMKRAPMTKTLMAKTLTMRTLMVRTLIVRRKSKK